MTADVVGQVVGGKFGNVIIRQKADTPLEIGELLVSDEGDGATMVLQVFDLQYASQLEDRIRQMESGMSLDGGVDAEFYEPEIVNYVLARAKQLVRIGSGGSVTIPKGLPTFFRKLRPITGGDLNFLKERSGMLVGQVRSGTKTIPDTGVWLPAEDTFSHHILIPATTGRGKSNLVKTLLYRVLDLSKVGALVLDAHDEHYGRHGLGLKDHPDAGSALEYYTAEHPPPGAVRLTINLQSLKPEHFEGIVGFTEPQSRAIDDIYRRHPDEWASKLLRGDHGAEDKKQLTTLSIIRARLQSVLDMYMNGEGDLVSRNGVFDSGAKGKGTIDRMVRSVEAGKVVVLDTSRLGDRTELVVGNMVASNLLRRYKAGGMLRNMPVATIVIEEAPRVIGEEVLESGGNIYSTIAREGRKFKIGLTAVTQLSSVIPKTILANMNTKIILGNELKQERAAVIASSSQDLSDDDRNIASLNRGDAIISSIFVPFAMPVRIPLFEDIVDAPTSSRKRMRIP